MLLPLLPLLPVEHLLLLLPYPGAVGKGLATLTFDDKFQQKRREMIKKRGNQDNLAVGMARNTR